MRTITLLIVASASGPACSLLRLLEPRPWQRQPRHSLGAPVAAAPSDTRSAMVERLYPGVYVTEIASRATPIDGVPVSGAPLAPLHAARNAAAEAAPRWTARNGGDPGVTLLQLSAQLAGSLRFGLAPTSGLPVHVVQSGYGVAQGLQVDSAGGDAGPTLKVSPGLASTPGGSAVDIDTPRDRHRIRKP